MESRVSYNTFYSSWHEAMKEANLTAEQYGRLTMAINEYCFNGIMPELEGIEKVLFIAFKPNIDASISSKIEGKKGGAPQNNKNAQKTTPLDYKKQPPLIIKNNPPCKNETTNGEGEEKGEEDVKDPESLFVSLWQKNGDVFNIFSRIEDFDAWRQFWDMCNFSPQFIETAIKNFTNAVRRGSIDPSYVPATPDRFVIKGWLQRSQSDFLSQDEQKEKEREKTSSDGVEKADKAISEFIESQKTAVDVSLKEGFKKAIKRGLDEL